MKMPTSDSEEKKVHEVSYASVAHLLRLDWNRILKYFEKVVGYYNSGFKRLFYPSIKTFDERTCKFEASAVFPFPWGGRPQTPALKTCLISWERWPACTRSWPFWRFSLQPLHTWKEFSVFLSAQVAQFTTWQSQQEHEIIKAKFPAKSKGNGLRVTIVSVDSTYTEIKKSTKLPARYFNGKKIFRSCYKPYATRTTVL